MMKTMFVRLASLVFGVCLMVVVGYLADLDPASVIKIDMSDDQRRVVVELNQFFSQVSNVLAEAASDSAKAQSLLALGSDAVFFIAQEARSQQIFLGTNGYPSMETSNLFRDGMPSTPVPRSNVCAPGAFDAFSLWQEVSGTRVDGFVNGGVAVVSAALKKKQAITDGGNGGLVERFFQLMLTVVAQSTTSAISLAASLRLRGTVGVLRLRRDVTAANMWVLESGLAPNIGLNLCRAARGGNNMAALLDFALSHFSFWGEKGMAFSGEVHQAAVRQWERGLGALKALVASIAQRLPPSSASVQDSSLNQKVGGELTGSEHGDEGLEKCRWWDAVCRLCRNRAKKIGGGNEGSCPYGDGEDRDMSSNVDIADEVEKKCGWSLLCRLCRSRAKKAEKRRATMEDAPRKYTEAAKGACRRWSLSCRPHSNSTKDATRTHAAGSDSSKASIVRDNSLESILAWLDD